MKRGWAWCWGLFPFVAVAYGLGLWVSSESRSREHSIAARSPEAAMLRLSPLGPYYLQGDRRWSHFRLGQSSDTLGRSGCTVSCAAMALSQKGFAVDPGELHGRLLRHQGYTRRGWLIWSAIARLTGGKHRAVVARWPRHRLIRRQLQKGHGVLAKIFLRGWTQHWVWIVAQSGREYWVKDPLEGSRRLRRLSSYRSRIYSIRWIQ